MRSITLLPFLQPFFLDASGFPESGESFVALHAQLNVYVHRIELRDDWAICINRRRSLSAVILAAIPQSLLFRKECVRVVAGNLTRMSAKANTSSSCTRVHPTAPDDAVVRRPQGAGRGTCCTGSDLTAEDLVGLCHRAGITPHTRPAAPAASA